MSQRLESGLRRADVAAALMAAGILCLPIAILIPTSLIGGKALITGFFTFPSLGVAVQFSGSRMAICIALLVGALLSLTAIQVILNRSCLC